MIKTAGITSTFGEKNDIKLNNGSHRVIFSADLPTKPLGIPMGQNSTRRLTEREKNLFYRVWYIQGRRGIQGEESKYPRVIDCNLGIVSRHEGLIDTIIDERKGWEKKFSDFMCQLMCQNEGILMQNVPGVSVNPTHNVSMEGRSLVGVKNNVDIITLGTTQNDPEKATRGSGIFSDINWDVSSVTESTSESTSTSTICKSQCLSFPMSLIDIMKTKLEIPPLHIHGDGAGPDGLPGELLDNDEEADETYRRLLRIAFTEIHNTSGSNESHFLGDLPSAHMGERSWHERNPSTMKTTLPRCHSENVVHTDANVPILSHMPTHRTPHELAASLDGIPLDSWMMPYIVAGSSADMTARLRESSPGISPSSSSVQPLYAMRVTQSMDVLCNDNHHLNNTYNNNHTQIYNHSHSHSDKSTTGSTAVPLPLHLPLPLSVPLSLQQQSQQQVPAPFSLAAAAASCKKPSDIYTGALINGIGNGIGVSTSSATATSVSMSSSWSSSSIERRREELVQQTNTNGYGNGGMFSVSSSAPSDNDFYFDSVSSSSPPLESPLHLHHLQSALSLSSSHGNNHSSNINSHSPPRTSLSSLDNSSWVDLGDLYMSSDPAWCPWTLRRLVLLDNYLFEFNVDGSAVIGYAQLHCAEITGTALQQSRSHKNNNGPNPSSSSSSSSSSSPLKFPHVLAVRVSYLRLNRASGPRDKFWIRCASFQSTLLLEDQLKMAAGLTMTDVYEWEATSDDTLLSKGRFTEVRVARRRLQPLLLSGKRRDSEKSKSSSSSQQTSVASSFEPPSTVQAHSSTFLPYSLLHLKDPHTGTFRSRTATVKDYVMTKSTHLTDRFSSTHKPSRMRAFSSKDSSNASYSLPSSSQSFSSSLETMKDYHSTHHPSLFGPSIALKMVSKKIFANRVEKGQERSDSLIREVLAQALVCHLARDLGLEEKLTPVVQIYGVFETLNDFCMELELMDSEDLFDKLTKRVHLTELETKSIISQLLEAISLCRLSGIAHRDVKMSNITLSRDAFKNGKLDLKRGIVKLADFGMAGFAGEEGLVHGRCGTIGYVAPEILLAGVHEGYENNVDMFSVGVVTYTLICGYEPFFGRDEAELKIANKEGRFEFESKEWQHISVEAKDWITRALQVNPHLRFTPEEARTHAWMAGMVSKAAWSPLDHHHHSKSGILSAVVGKREGRSSCRMS
eukprot:gene6586-13325_t